MNTTDASAFKKRTEKAENAFRTISEVSQSLELQQHVLRFWETKFTQVKPVKRGGGRRYYRPEDIELLKYIQNLLYNEGYTIKGVQKLLKTKTKAELMADAGQANAPSPAVAPAPVENVIAKSSTVVIRASSGAMQTGPIVSAIPPERDAMRARQLRQRRILESMLGDLVELRDTVRRVREASNAIEE